MSSQRTFRIGLIGFPEKEQNVLQSIFWLSKTRPRIYTLANVKERQKPEILMVNADDERAMGAWKEYQKREGESSSAPAVMVTRDKDVECEENYVHHTPFVASRLLKMLDQVTIRELDFIPELNIGEHDEANSEATTAVLEQVMKKESVSHNHDQKILVVDDNQTVRKQMELELRNVNADVAFAENGEQALELLQGQHFDIVFLDVVMPGIDGYQVCKTIKRDKDKKASKVIMLTSKSSPFDKVKGALSGCDNYLTKPLSHDDFHEILDKYLMVEEPI